MSLEAVRSAILRCPHHAGRVVGQHRVDLERDVAVQQHGRDAQVDQPLPGAGVRFVVQGHDDAVGAAILQHVDGRGLFLGLAPSIDEIERVALRTHLGIRGFEGFGMQRIGDVVHDEAHGQRIAPPHVLRPAVGTEIQRDDRRADLGQGCGPNR
jgi:hypothetical protein